MVRGRADLGRTGGGIRRRGRADARGLQCPNRWPSDADARGGRYVKETRARAVFNRAKDHVDVRSHPRVVPVPFFLLRMAASLNRSSLRGGGRSSRNGASAAVQRVFLSRLVAHLESIHSLRRH